MTPNTLFYGSGIDLLKSLPDNSAQLIWTDPPFGTGTFQTTASTGNRYRDVSVEQAVTLIGEMAEEASRVISPDGVVAVCLDYRSVHLAWCELAKTLEPQQEIVWSFGLGRGSSRWWTNKHNTILLFSKMGGSPRFYYGRVPEVPRKAPKDGYSQLKKVASVWDFTLSNTNPERVGYPNQKPAAIIQPFIEVHSDAGDLVVDPFGGSGSTAAVALKLGRRFATADVNPEAIQVMTQRLGVQPTTPPCT